MSNYNSELLDFEMEIGENLENVSKHHYNVQSANEENKFEQNHSLPDHQKILFDENDPSMSSCQGEDLRNVRNIVTNHGTLHYPESDLNKYLNYIDSSVGPTCPSTQYVENRKNHSLDEFFHDLQEIISLDMKTPSKEHDHGRSVATLDPNHTLTFDDTKHFPSHGSDVDFSFDLTQVYVNAPHESDLMMLQSPVDFASHIQSQYDAHNESRLFDNHSTAMIHNSNGHATESLHVNTGTIENDQLKPFYLDLKMNGDVARGSHEDNSIVTYMKNEGLQSFEYINDSGETETVVYVDQASNDLSKEEGVQSLEYRNDTGEVERVMYIDQASNDLKKKGVESMQYINESGETGTVVYVDQTSHDQNQNSNGVDVTQYEIINYDANQYQNENDNSTMQTNEIISLPVKHVDSNEQFTFNDGSQNISYQPDILSTLLSDKNNKIIIVAKPLKNPKVRLLTDEFNATFKEIIAPNIPLPKRSTISRSKSCRKQKLELINQMDSLLLPKSTERRGRPNKTNKKMLSTASFIPETPKLPSKYIRERKKNIQLRRKKPRKLIWDSDSDCVNENCNDEENNKDM